MKQHKNECVLGNCWDSTDEHEVLPTDEWCPRCRELVSIRCAVIEGEVAKVSKDPSRYCQETRAASEMMSWLLRKIALLQTYKE